MTQPPQQPGFPQEPNPHNPQGQQQPNPYPGSQPFPTQGQPSQGQYGQPGYPMGNQQYSGYPGGPKKPKTGLIIGLVAAGVLVVGGIVALILVLTGKNDAEPNAAAPTSNSQNGAPSSAPSKPSGSTPGGTGGTGGSAGAEAVGKDFITKLSSGDAAGAKALICKELAAEGEKQVDQYIAQKAQFTFDRVGELPVEVPGFEAIIAKGTLNGQPSTIGVGIATSTSPCVGGIIPMSPGQ